MSDQPLSKKAWACPIRLSSDLSHLGTSLYVAESIPDNIWLNDIEVEYHETDKKPAPPGSILVGTREAKMLYLDTCTTCGDTFWRALIELAPVLCNDCLIKEQPLQITNDDLQAYFHQALKRLNTTEERLDLLAYLNRIGFPEGPDPIFDCRR